MLQKFYKYHGAGNDFLLADNREGFLSLSQSQIRHLCDRHTGFGADGVMMLERSERKDFRMVFFNPDGSGGMMCGNGGRCIVAFAADLGVVSGNFPIEFEAPDGLHTAVILNQAKGSRSSAGTKGPVIRLKMGDVSGITEFKDEDAFFLETGARHLVKFVTGLEDYPVRERGKSLRHDPRFAPEGVNVDFVEVVRQANQPLLRIRTFEKGVEDETLACGTGIVASAIASCFKGIPFVKAEDGRASVDVKAAISTLSVDFVPQDRGAGDVWLTGPAVFTGTVECFL
ncbi:MAG: diaminopimelate epimerase [Bacteroidales bacterium]|nr:diaminopimelate epimerase [Bacteroidales bacterium]